MRTLTIEKTVFNHDDLTKLENREILENVLRQYEPNTDYIFMEAKETVEKFNELFGVHKYHRSWLETDFSKCSNNAYQYDLEGMQLHTYMVNNYFYKLYTQKVYHSKTNYKVSRKSKINFEHNDMVLTGVCYDVSILAPMYEFIENFNPNTMTSVTFEMLINDCLYKLCKDLDNEVEYRSTQESILEEIQMNGYEFDEFGNMY